MKGIFFCRKMPHLWNCTFRTVHCFCGSHTSQQEHRKLLLHHTGYESLYFIYSIYVSSWWHYSKL